MPVPPAKLVSSFSIWLPKKLGGEITRCRYSWTCENGDRYSFLSGLKKINSDLGSNGTGPKFLTCPKTAQAVFTIGKVSLNFWPFADLRTWVGAIRFIAAQ